MAASLAFIDYFLPIFAFLFVFLVVYSLLMKTKVLGDNGFVAFFISFALASFFIVQASLVQFIQFSSAGFAVIVVAIFFFLGALAFLPGSEPLAFLNFKNWFSWVVLGAILAMFIIVSAYVFNWSVDVSSGSTWSFIHSDWFGMILLLLVAGLVSWKISK